MAISPDLKEALELIQSSLEGAGALRGARRSRIVADSQKNLEDFNDSLKNLKDELDIMANKTLPEARHYVANHSKATENLTSQLGKAARAQSLLAASLLENHNEIKHGTAEYHEMMMDMHTVGKLLNENILKQADAWDDTTKSIKKNLRPTDFAHIRLALGEAQTAIHEALGKGGLAGLGVLAGASQEAFIKGTSANTPAGEGVQNKLFDLMTKLNVSFDPKELQKNSELFQQKVQELYKTATVHAEAEAEFNKIAYETNTVAGGWKRNIGKMIEDVTGVSGAAKLAKLGLLALGEAELVRTSLAKMREGFKEFAQDLVKFNTAQVPQTLIATKWAAYNLGLSFDDTIKFMQENKRVMALFGAGFKPLTSEISSTFQKFGYTMQQGAELVGPAFQAAIASGVNVRNGAALNGFINDSMQAFQDVAGITNLTAKEFMEMRTQLLQSAEVQGNLLGLDRQAQTQRVKDIDLLRKHYMEEGLQVEQINDLIKAQEAQRNEPVKEQIANAAKLALGAQAAGLGGAQAARLQQLYLMGGAGRANVKGANEEFENLMKQAQMGLAQQQARAAASGNVGTILGTENFQQFVQGVSGAASSQVEAAKVADMNAKAGNTLTDAQTAQQAALAKGSQTVGVFGNVVNRISSVLNDSLGKVAIGAGGSLLFLALNSTLAARALGRVGGGGVGGALGGIVGRIFGGGGGAGGAAAKTVAKEGEEIAAKEGEKVVAKALGKTALKSIIKKIPIIGALGGLAFGAQRAFAGDWKGAGLEAASGLAGTIPGVGTAASLGIDAAIAARDMGAFGTPGATPPGAAVNTGEAPPTEAGQSVMSVQDSDAQGILQKISEDMARSVTLLQQILTANTKVTAGPARTNLPSATSYITGRQQAMH